MSAIFLFFIRIIPADNHFWLLDMWFTQLNAKLCSAADEIDFALISCPKKDTSIESPSEMLLSMDDKMHFLHWRYIIPLRYSIFGLPVFCSYDTLVMDAVKSECFSSVNLLMVIHPERIFPGIHAPTNFSFLSAS